MAERFPYLGKILVPTDKGQKYFKKNVHVRQPDAILFPISINTRVAIGTGEKDHNYDCFIINNNADSHETIKKYDQEIKVFPATFLNAILPEDESLLPNLDPTLSDDFYIFFNIKLSRSIRSF
jgi:hypothetical protein